VESHWLGVRRWWASDGQSLRACLINVHNVKGIVHFEINFFDMF